MARRARPRFTGLYAAHAVPGLEDVAADEITARAQGRVVRTLTGFDERAGLVLFESDAPPAALLELGVTEDVFAVGVLSDRLPPGRAALDAIAQAIAHARTVEWAASTAASLRRTRRSTFRVVARLAGRDDVRRVDVARTAAEAFASRMPRWRRVDEDARFEVWVHVVAGTLLCGLRMSDATMRNRGGRAIERSAALKPTVARAMVVLAGVAADDVVCDPMCGSATILVERALAGRYRALVGGDVDPSAIEAGRANIGRRFRPITLARWNATRLPLRDGGVTKIVSNLPFGRRVGEPAAVPSLYARCVAEWARVLRPDGTMALLVSDADVIRRAAQRAGLREVSRRRVVVRGMAAALVVIARDRS